LINVLKASLLSSTLPSTTKSQQMFACPFLDGLLVWFLFPVSQIYLSSEGKLGLRDQIPRDEGNSLLPGKWHVVSLSVDTTAGTIIIYIDGKLASTVLSPEIAVPDGNFSVYQQVCLFGSKDASETIGGNIKSFYFEDRVFGPAVWLPGFYLNFVTNSQLYYQDAQGLYESLQLESSWECEVRASLPIEIL